MDSNRERPIHDGTHYQCNDQSTSFGRGAQRLKLLRQGVGMHAGIAAHASCAAVRIVAQQVGIAGLRTVNCYKWNESAVGCCSRLENFIISKSPIGLQSPCRSHYRAFNAMRVHERDYISRRTLLEGPISPSTDEPGHVPNCHCAIRPLLPLCFERQHTRHIAAEYQVFVVLANGGPADTRHLHAYL